MSSMQRQPLSLCIFFHDNVEYTITQSACYLLTFQKSVPSSCLCTFTSEIAKKRNTERAGGTMYYIKIFDDPAKWGPVPIFLECGLPLKKYAGCRVS